MAKPLTVYKASAGSGKTFTLAAEYIALLVKAAVRGNTEAFKHIVAVTFTVKATGEMKDRILGTLYNLGSIVQRPGGRDLASDETVSYLRKITQLTRQSVGNCPLTDAELQELPAEELLDLPSTEEICKAAQSVLITILHSYDQFKISTIDSFFQSVLKGVARELGLPANLRTEISDDEVRLLAVQRLMDNLDKNPQLQSQILHFVDDSLDEGRSWKVAKALTAFAQELGKEAYGDCGRQLQERLAENPNLLKDIYKKLISTKKNAENEVKSATEMLLVRLDQAAMESAFTNSKGFGIALLRSACHAMQSFSYGTELSTRAQGYLDKPEGILKKPTKSTQADFDRLLPEAEGIISDFAIAFETYKRLLSERNTATLVLENLHQLGLMAAIDALIKEVNDEKGQFLLSHTGPLLNDLMTADDGNTDFVFEKIGPMLNQIMIDEFQDTSNLQWSNFRPLVEELMSRNTGHLIVGDVKQSIYRWRNGDWRILGNLERDFSGQVHAEPLVHNFRSDKTIIDFNNFVFPKLAALLDAQAREELPLADPTGDYSIITTAYTPSDVQQLVPDHKAVAPAKGRVRVRIYAKESLKKELMMDDICNEVDRLHQLGTPYNEMAILVRASTIVPSLIEAFSLNEKTRNVRLVFTNAYKLVASIAVAMLVASLRYLANSGDNVAKSFIALHYQKDILHSGIKEDAIMRSIASRDDSLLPDCLRNEYAALQKLPLYELNERLMSEMRLGDLPGQAEYLMVYFDNLKAFLKDYGADLQTFITYWNEKLHDVSIVPTDNDVLPILTIHASKGLAYKHVFMPDCDFKLSGFKGTSIYWTEPEAGSDYAQLPKVPINFNSTKVENSDFAKQRQEEIYQQLMDSINMLYVGFTRAKTGLYVWSCENSALKVSSSMGTALKQVLKGCGEGVLVEEDENAVTYLLDDEHRTSSYGSMFAGRMPKPKTAGKSRPSQPSRMEPEFAEAIPCRIGQMVYKPNFRQSTEAARLTANEAGRVRFAVIEEGNAFHDILAYTRTASDFDKAVARYKQEFSLSVELERKIRDLFSKGLKNEVISDWFSGSYDVYNEQSVVMLVGGKVQTRRPDRVMLSKDGRRVVVVDYKFTSLATARSKEINGENQLDKYRSQIADYVSIMQEIFPAKTIEGCLWFVRDGKILGVKSEE